MGWLDRFRRATVEVGAAAARFEALIRERNRQIGLAVGAKPRAQVATPTFDLATRILPSFDPMWLHNGVLVFEPTNERRHWVYTTSGLSTPWYAQDEADLASDGPSAVGYELSMAVTEESDWPIQILNVLMLVSLGIWSGRMPGRLFARGERVPLAPMGLQFRDTQIATLLTMSPPFASPSFALRSGRVEWIHLLGVTQDEHAWLARTDPGLHDAWVQQLGCVTDFGRSSSL
jgi:Suppressor of fused protein (SUFU)